MNTSERTQEAPGSAESAASAGLRQRLSAPVDIASLVVFRIAFGLIIVWEAYRYFDKGWIRRYWIEPDFFFTYQAFGWVEPWGGDGMFIHFAALGALGLLIAAGLAYRASAALFFCGFAYVFLLDKTWYLNHAYLITLLAFLLILVPAHRAGSVDALLRPRLRSSTVPAVYLWLLRAQLGLVYFFGGIAKLNGDWLTAQPTTQWVAERDDMPLLGELFTHDAAGYAIAYGGLLFDLLVVPLLLWRRTRALAFVLAVMFHLLNSQLFNIGVFPWLMLAATTLFLPPDWPRSLWGVVSRRKPGRPPRAARTAARPLAPVAVALLVAWFALQVALPLRHHVYPGSVHWTDEGHRFAWHMKLRHKEAELLRFTARDPMTGKHWNVDPRHYLAPRQLEQMSQHADMVLQFAHHAESEHRLRGGRDIEVRAEVWISLNGRLPQLLIDPSVDLTQRPRSLAHAPWIRDLDEPLSRPVAAD